MASGNRHWACRSWACMSCWRQGRQAGRLAGSTRASRIAPDTNSPVSTGYHATADTLKRCAPEAALPMLNSAACSVCSALDAATPAWALERSTRALPASAASAPAASRVAACAAASASAEGCWMS